MKQPRQKRLFLDKHGQYHPQYKGWFFWHTYVYEHNSKYVSFYCKRDAELFLESKHRQDLNEIKRYNEQGPINWSPEEIK